MTGISGHKLLSHESQTYIHVGQEEIGYIPVIDPGFYPRWKSVFSIPSISFNLCFCEHLTVYIHVGIVSL